MAKKTKSYADYNSTGFWYFEKKMMMKTPEKKKRWCKNQHNFCFYGVHRGAPIKWV